MANVTVHYDDNNSHTYPSQDIDCYYWKIGHKFSYDSSIFEYYGVEKYSGYFEVVEKSEDGKDVWVEWVK